MGGVFVIKLENKKTGILLYFLLGFVVLVIMLIIILVQASEIKNKKGQLDIYAYEKEFLLQQQEDFRLQAELLLSRNAEQVVELFGYIEREAGLLDKIEERTESRNEYYRKLLLYENTRKNIIVSDNDIVINRYMPMDLVALLETHIRAISTGDEELFLSVLGIGVSTAVVDSSYYEYFFRRFEQYKFSDFTLKKIAVYGSNDKGFQRGGFFLDIITVDGNNKINFFQAGVTREYFTGDWIIYDYD